MGRLAMSAALALSVNAAAAQDGSRDVMVVFDMSGSMWGQVDGVTKVEIAKDAFGGLLADWEDGTVRPGLIAYGHRRRGDCGDIEVMARPGDGADLESLLAPMSPRGKTPLSDAVREAAEILRFTEEAATVVLLSDGVETCDADPCAVGAELEQLGVDFTAHVIGFDIAEGDREQLQCLAENTGGRYFDAADAGDLSDAMDAVADITAAPAPETVQETPETASVILRLNKPVDVAFPDEAVVTLADGTEIVRIGPDDRLGMTVDLPLGPVALNVDGGALTASLALTVAPDTGIVDILLEPADGDYAAWGNGPYPIGRDQTILYMDRSGVERGAFRMHLVPQGAGIEASLGASVVTGGAGEWTKARLPSPPAPGTYEALAVSPYAGGEEYGRVPITFAAEVEPEWRGDRSVEPGGRIRAEWAGDANRSIAFRLTMEGARAIQVVVDGMHDADGFFLTAPETPGLWDLSILWRDVEGTRIETSLGQIAVGVPLPSAEEMPPSAETLAVTEPPAAEPAEEPSGAAPPPPPPPNPMAEEADAMGGEEGPLTPVGELHGDWMIVFEGPDGEIPLLDMQLVHEEGALRAGGDFVVRAHPAWGAGETGAFGEVFIEVIDDLMTMAVRTPDGVTAGRLARGERGWEGELDLSVEGWTEVPTVLMRRDAPLEDASVTPVEDGAGSDVVFDNDPVANSLIAVDERGERLTTETTWEIESVGAQDFETFVTAGGKLYEEARLPGIYEIRVRSGNLVGDAVYTFGKGLRGANFIVMAPDGEGTDMPFDPTFFCSPGEDCDFAMPDAYVTFSLPTGWGSERPILGDGRTVMFNMATLDPDGTAFYVTLNQPQRAASLGPCREILHGTLCHDATDGPARLAEVDMIARSLSVAPFRLGLPLGQEDIGDMLAKLSEGAE